MPKRIASGIELLADPTRRQIIAAIALRPRRPSSLAAELGLSRPAVTHQLNLLIDAGLVRVSPFLADGRGRLYRLEPYAVGPITAWLAGTEIGRPGRLRGALRDDAPASKAPAETFDEPPTDGRGP
jgi:DNA-binding transcriptional ArsR family regulator